MSSEKSPSLWDAKVPLQSRLDGHSDLISFLSVLQATDVDLLSVTWQPETESLGEGGTAIISQALVNLEISFAFKRIVKLSGKYGFEYPRSRSSTVQGEFNSREANEKYEKEAKVWRAILAEILVSRHPALRDHPNILSVQGVCWEIDKESQRVWPVLIFPKSEFGDLRSFIGSDDGQRATVEERINLCRDVAQALFLLHANGKRENHAANLSVDQELNHLLMNEPDIIHGDIKPQNVLIFKDSHGIFRARLADFGYSTLSSSSERIYPPNSKPWTAPEHHYRGFSPLSAKRMDVYSLGMLCVWTLYRKYFSSDSHFWADLGQTNFSNEQTREELSGLAICEGSGGLFVRVKKLINSWSNDLEEERGERLAVFFRSTLATNPEEREIDVAVLIGHLEGQNDKAQDDSASGKDCGKHLHSEGGPAGPSPPLTSVPVFQYPPHCNFQISRDIVELSRAHYQVRKAIFESLYNKAQHAICSECRPLANFQLAVCYSLGFGVPRDTKKASQYLEKSGAERSKLDDEIKTLKSEPRIAIENENMWKLYDEGHLVGFELSQHYINSKDIEVVERIYQQEIEDMQSALGEDHIVVQDLESTLGKLLCEKGDFRAAEILQLGLKQKTERKYGLQSPRTWNMATELSSTYGKQGKWLQAIPLLESTIRVAKDSIGPQHMDVGAMTGCLASAYVGQGRFKEAEALCLEQLENLKRVVGQDHPFVLDDKKIIASAYEGQGRLSDAENILLEVIEGSSKMLGPNHQRTMLAKNALAMIWSEKREYEKAEILQSGVVQAWESVYGPRHPWTLTSTSNLALIYKDKGNLDRARELLEKTIATSLEVSGLESVDTLMFKNNLACVMQEQEQWHELEAMQLQVHSLSRKIMGEDHPTCVAYAINLAKTYNKLGDHQKAEKISYDALATAKQALGPEHYETLKCMSSLATTYRAQGRWKEAGILASEMVEIAKRTLGLEHPFTLVGMDNLAAGYSYEARYAEAETLLLEVLELRSRVNGPVHIATLSTMNNLGRVYCGQQRLQEAAELDLVVATAAIEELGLQHPFTLRCINGLATTYTLQGFGPEQVAQLVLDDLGVEIELAG